MFELVSYILLIPLVLSTFLVNPEISFNINLHNGLIIILVSYFLVGILFIILGNISNFYKIKKLGIFIFYYIFMSFLGLFLLKIFYQSNILEINPSLRAYGKISFVFLVISLSISPILKLFPTIQKTDNFILIRKISGIVSVMRFLKHGFDYFLLDYYFEAANSYPLFHILNNLITRVDVFIGVIGGVILLLLGLTSNSISQKILGIKKWKFIHSFVYVLFFLVLIHIAFASSFDAFYIFLFTALFLLRITAYIFPQTTKSDNKNGNRYVCKPCGYIYNVSLGDESTGIAPGTKFEDLPHNRVCPVCGAGLSDFEILGGKKSFLNGQVVGYKMITHNVLELKIKFNQRIKYNPGQYMQFSMNDKEGEFIRNYSILESTGNVFTFAIKLFEGGRGASYLKSLLLGDPVQGLSITGDFMCKKSKNKKVFIGTGTGIVPIYNIAKSCPGIKYLYFSVSNKIDLIYESELIKIPNLKTNFHITRESQEGYIYGRINLSEFDYDKDTEFYISGNKDIVDSFTYQLKNLGYKNIYTEKFIS